MSSCYLGQPMSTDCESRSYACKAPNVVKPGEFVKLSQTEGSRPTVEKASATSDFIIGVAMYTEKNSCFIPVAISGSVIAKKETTIFAGAKAGCCPAGQCWRIEKILKCLKITGASEDCWEVRFCG